MYHLCGYYKLALDNTADSDITAITDDALTIVNNHFQFQQDTGLMAAFAGSATLNRVKIETPAIRQVGTVYVRPIQVALLPAANPNVQLFDWNVFRMRAGEEVQMKATSTVAMTESFYGLLWTTVGFVPVPSGNIYTLRGTSVTAAAVGAWTSVTVTWSDNLPAGRYALVLSECFSTNAVAHRWIVSLQQERPGHFSFASQGSRIPYAITKGQFGVMGYFRNTDLPRLQVLCNVADAAHTVFMHCIKVGD